MKFSAILAPAVLVGTTLASPLTDTLRTRRIQAQGDSKSDNWAGAILVGKGYTAAYVDQSAILSPAASDANQWTTSSAQFTVPQISKPPGGNDTTKYCVAIWVGIDGWSCHRSHKAILQARIDAGVLGNGAPSITPWYEWYSDAQHTFDFSLSVGDEVNVSVEAYSERTGIAIIQNLSKPGQKGTHNFTSGTRQNLCERNAEWIAEDFASAGLTPLADFGTLEFKNAKATQNGESVDDTHAQTVFIGQDDKRMTSEQVKGSRVRVEYVYKG